MEVVKSNKTDDQIKEQMRQSMARVDGLRRLNDRAEKGLCCAPVQRGRAKWGSCRNTAKNLGRDGLTYCEFHKPINDQ